LFRAICGIPIQAEPFRCGDRLSGLKEGQAATVAHAEADCAPKLVRRRAHKGFECVKHLFHLGERHGLGDACETSQVGNKDVCVGDHLGAMPLRNAVHRDRLGKSLQRETVDECRLYLGRRQSVTGGGCDVDLVCRRDRFNAHDECQQFADQLAVQCCDIAKSDHDAHR